MVRPLMAIALCLPLFSLAAENTTNYDEAGMSLGREYLDQHFGERIDPFTGNLELQFTDLVIPGNGGFDLKVKRVYNANQSTPSPFGRGWDIHFGRVTHLANETCATATAQSMALVLPDGSAQTLHRSNGAGFTSTTDYLTTNFWKAQCDSSGGVNVYAPDGTKYAMTVADGDKWHVSRITNKYGSYMDFTYATVGAGLYVSEVHASDGRSVTFSYANGRLASIAGGNVTWSYSVTSAADGSARLTGVTPPAGGAWSFQYNENLGTAAGSYALSSLTNPFGGQISYSYGFVNFLSVLNANPTQVLTQKIAGGATWNYAYNPSCSGGGLDQTIVTLPGGYGTVVYRHFGYCSVNAGEVWKVGLLSEKQTGSAQTEDFTWAFQTISNETVQRPGYGKTDPQVNRPLLSRRDITRDGRLYTTAYSGFDSFGNPNAITETGTRSRSRSVSYFNNSSAWIVGLKTDDSYSGAGDIQ
jgi:hypothetical protein